MDGKRDGDDGDEVAPPASGDGAAQRRKGPGKEPEGINESRGRFWWRRLGRRMAVAAWPRASGARWRWRCFRRGLPASVVAKEAGERVGEHQREEGKTAVGFV